jgi:hypothetical protein
MGARVLRGRIEDFNEKAAPQAGGPIFGRSSGSALREHLARGM